MIQMRSYLLCLAFVASLAACDKEEIPAQNETVEYLHISHTRTDANPTIDSTAAKIDYTKYDMLWLGGDLAYLTSQDQATLSYVDAIFNLSSRNTLFALGNHDYSDTRLISQTTGRASYYTHHKNGITFLVLDTQIGNTNISGDQKTMVDAVLDTIENSSHLVILSHKLLWMYDDNTLMPIADSISNGRLGGCGYCIQPNDFNAEIRPRLAEVEQQGIEVICIAGDIGFRVKEFEYLSPEGIDFLASGVKADKLGNLGLRFTHDLTERTLTWEFVATELL